MGYLDNFIRRKTTIKLGGKDYVFTELSMADFGQFRAWVRKQQEDSRNKRRDRLLADAKEIGNVDPIKLLEQLDKPITEEEIDDQMETTDGIAYLAHLSLKYENSGIQLGEVSQMITVEKIGEISKVIAGSMGDEKKTKRKRQPVKR